MTPEGVVRVNGEGVLDEGNVPCSEYPLTRCYRVPQKLVLLLAWGPKPTKVSFNTE